MLFERRGILHAAALAGALAGLPECAAKPSDTKPEGARASEREMRVLTRVSALTIPLTDTPGAAETDAADFVVLGLAHGLAGSGESVKNASSPLTGLLLLTRFIADLDEAAGGDFLKAGPERQLQGLTMIDNRAFGEDGKGSPWRKIKALILTGYYTSEAGASQELQYELVPGSWDGDVALTDDARAYSSDWTSLSFG
jgi:hypothetical protein